MGNGEDDVLFRIGFEDHPDSRSRLNALAESVEETQARISKAVEATGARAIAQMYAVRSEAMKPIAMAVASSPSSAAKPPSSMPRSGGGTVTDRGGFDDRMSDESKFTDAFLRFSQSRQSALQKEIDLAIAFNRARREAMASSVSSPQVPSSSQSPTETMDASKRIRAEQSVTQAAVEAHRTRSQVESTAANEISQRMKAREQAERRAVEQAREDLARRLELFKAEKAASAQSADSIVKDRERINDAMSEQPARQVVTAPQRQADVPVRQETQSMVPISRSDVEQIMREDQRLRDEIDRNNKAKGQSDSDYTALHKAMADARRIAMNEEAETMRAGVRQIIADVELLNRVTQAGGAAEIGVSESDVNAAKLRILKVHDAHVAAEESATQAILREQKAREEAARNAAREQGLRVQQQIMAERAAVEEGRKALAERLEIYKKQKAEAKKVADATIREAERERVEAIKAAKAVAAEREKMHKEQQSNARASAQPFIDAYVAEEKAANDAMGKITSARGQLTESVLSSGDAIGKLLRGAVLLGVAEGAEMEAAMRALAGVQAGIDAFSGSVQLIRNMAKGMAALRTITMATTAAKTAENAASRIAVASSGAVKVALDIEALSAQNAARAHAMLAAARNVRGGRGGAAAIGSTAIDAATNTARTGGARGFLGRAVGGAASMVGLGGMGGGAATGGTAAVGTGAAATGATALAALAGAAVAAAGGLAMTGKGAYDLYENFKKNGFRSNAEKGSYADVVGGNKFNPFAALWAWSDRATLAQKEEITARMQAQSVLFKLEAEHNKNLAKLEIDSLYQRNKAAKDLEVSFAMERIDRLRTPQEQAAATDTVIGDMRNDVSAKQDALKQFERTDLSTGAVTIDYETTGAQQALAELEDAQGRLNDTLAARMSIEKELQAENRRTTLEAIKGIEDTIRARQEERSALEDSLKSAQEKFGEMSAAQQAQTIKSLEKARSGQTLTRKDLERLDTLGTDEAKGFSSQAKIAKAEAAGFTANDLAKNERQGIEAKDKAINEGIDQLASKSGQDRAALAKNAGTPKIDIVDQTQLNVALNVQEDVLFDKIAQAIEQARRDMAATLERKLSADLAAQQAAERRQFEERTAPDRTP